MTESNVNRYVHKKKLYKSNIWAIIFWIQKNKTILHCKKLNHYIFSNTHYDGDDVEYVEYNANFNRFLGSELVKEKGEGGGRERLGGGAGLFT